MTERGAQNDKGGAQNDKGGGLNHREALRITGRIVKHA